MRKHFIWLLVILSGCGTAGNVGTAGAEGGGNPDVQGEWVFGTFGRGLTVVFRFDALGRLEATASRTENAGIPGLLQPSVTWAIVDYAANTAKSSSPDGFITTALGSRAETSWSGRNVIIDHVIIATGDVLIRWELSLIESFNGVTLSGTQTAAGIIGGVSFREAAPLGLDGRVPW